LIPSWPAAQEGGVRGQMFNDVLKQRGIRSYRLDITPSDDDELPPLVFERFCSADVSVVRDAQKACLQALARGASEAVLDTIMFRVHRSIKES